MNCELSVDSCTLPSAVDPRLFNIYDQMKVALSRATGQSDQERFRHSYNVILSGVLSQLNRIAAVKESGDIATGYLTSDAYNVIHIHCHTQTQASQIEEWRGAVALCDTTS